VLQLGHISTDIQPKFVDPTNTTRTAQYAALAAKSSCRLALVSSDMAAAKRSVKTIKTPIAAKMHSVLFMVESRYILKTGAASKRNSTTVIMRFTSFETLEGAK
jgi:hypothetical protein